MSYPVYYPIEGDTLVHLFNTFAGSTGAPITMTNFAVGDIQIYKDGSTTQRSSTAGFTLLDTDGVDFDAITGIHGFSIDLSENTDASFYTVGPWYHIVVSTVTVDAQTLSFVACAFRIVSATRGLAGTALPNAAADAAGGLAISDAGGLDLDAILVDTTSLNDTALADSVPADGSLPTVRQSLYMLSQFMFERSVSSTTLTVRKADGSTALMTFTLNDATSPTSITRTT